MNPNDIDARRLLEMLRELPEREPPAGLAARIMAGIETRPRSLWRQIRGLLTAVFFFHVQPLRLAAVGGGLVLAFWLGLTVGGQRSGSDDVLVALSEFPGSSEANYLIGRGLLADGQWDEALPFLRRAAVLAADNPEYALWTGIALGKKGDLETEREVYRETVSRYPDYVPARMYLGHNLLESGLAAEALEEYDRVLVLAPDRKTALYNRALAGRELGDRDLATAAWKEYLHRHRTGKWAYRAVANLNALGDYTYRVYQIGHRRAIFNQELLLGPDSDGRRREIERLAAAFVRASGETLDLVVFLAGEPIRAENRARELQHLIGGQMGGHAGKKVRISWFDEPERLETASGEVHALDKGLLMFCTPQVQQTGERMI